MMPMRGELQLSEIGLNDRQSLSGTRRRSGVRSWIAETVSDPEFGILALFCAVGLWLTFYFLHFFQSFAALGMFS